MENSKKEGCIVDIIKVILALLICYILPYVDGKLRKYSKTKQREN